MSDYYDQPRRQKSSRGAKTRDSYAEESGYGRDGGRGDAGSLVRRRDSNSSVDEEITREFPPGDGGRGYYRETTIRKSGTRPVRARSYGADSRYDDKSSYASSRRYNDYSSKRSSRGYDDRRDDRRSGGGRSRRDQSYSSDDSRSRSRSRDKGRRKSGIEEAIGALGLGGVLAAVTGKKDDRSRSKSRDRGGRGRRGSSSSDRTRGGRKRSKSRGVEQISQAVKAALLAGAGEAFRARKEPGGWGGDKGKRVLTAAIAAGGVDGILTQKKDPDKHSTRDVIGSALAGLAANRVINGARSKSQGPARDGSPDGRGRSQSRGGLGDLLAGGALAGVAKKGYDNWRSRSRGRERSVSSSGSSYDSRRSPRARSQTRRRSQSVSGYAAKGLAALGLKDAADKVDPERRNSKRGSTYTDGGYGDRDVGSRSRSIGPDGNDGTISKRVGTRYNGYELDYKPHHTGDPETDSDSDLGSSSGEEKEVKKGRRKSLITAGLATVATIHAGHSVYQSYEKRQERRKQVAEGEISQEEAKKLKNKGRLQDAASIGIAALGIKGAYSEWNEMREHNAEMGEYKEKVQRHREKRAARREKLEREARKYKESGYTSSMPNLVRRDDGGYYDSPPAGYAHGAATHYYDANPYSTGPPAAGYDGFPPPPPGPPPPGTYR